MGFFTFTSKKDKLRRSSSPPPPPKLPSRRTKTHPPPQPQSTPSQLPSSLFEPPNVYVECDTGRDSKDQKRPRHKSSRAALPAPPDQDRRHRDRERHSDRRKKEDKQQHGVLAYHQRNASTSHLTPSFRPAGYLTAGPSAPAQSSSNDNQNQAWGPVVVNNHYYLSNSPPLPQRHRDSEDRNTRERENDHSSRQLQQSPYSNQAKFSKSVAHLAHLAHDATAVPHAADAFSLPAWYNYSTNLMTSTVHVCDDISNRLNNVLTAIDGECMSGHEQDLYTCKTPSKPQNESQQLRLTEKEHGSSKSSRKSSRDKDREKTRDKDRDSDKDKNHRGNDATGAVVKGDYFSKVELYANSKLPKGLPPMSVYVPTWPLLCLAAQHSLSVYEKPTGAAREAHVSGDWRSGTKAMCIKSVPMDAMNTIVFAIRGTATFMDWAVNLNHAPTAPTNFLDDTGNLCHAGFLTVARRMVEPVAARLRQLLEEDPSRSRYSLLITGHSAGGAVASLLYSHMLAESKEAESELNQLTNSFKRVHCVTFGTPPLTLLPLTKPDRPELKNSVFLSFINEGDPVVRADKAYIKSLLELLGSPPPEAKSSRSRESREKRRNSSPDRESRHRSHSRTRKSSKPVWSVPPNTLSLAGRLIVMRSGRVEGSDRVKGRMTVEDRLDAGVEAFVCQDDDLRGLVWGDPVAHMMKLYAKRVETLAVDTITMKR